MYYLMYMETKVTMINHEHKFIFLHIPKCAGTSVGQTLKDIAVNDPNEWHAYACNGEHHVNPYGDLHCKEFGPERHFDIFDEQMWKDYFVFTFTRNPWDRMVSHYKFRHQDFGVTQGFEYFVKNFESLCEKWSDENDLYGERILLPSQTDFLRGTFDYNIQGKGIDYRKYIDFYGKFENLQEDFDTILNRIGDFSHTSYDGLWHRNKSEYIIDDWRTMYTQELREYVAHKYSEDIMGFNYSF